MLFKFQISFMCVCEKVQVKNCKSTMMFSGCTALKYSCSLLLDGQNSRHETTEDGFETNMTMQEKRRILFLVGPVLFHDKHMDYAAWIRSSECSVLINVHVIYSSTVKFTTQTDSIKHGLHTVCHQASGANCGADAWRFDNIATHVLGAEASASWFVGSGGWWWTVI